jgi:predicted DNA-binding transcriptional regulator AlpA
VPAHVPALLDYDDLFSMYRFTKSWVQRRVKAGEFPAPVVLPDHKRTLFCAAAVAAFVKALPTRVI